MTSTSILIPNRYSWDGICLTIESIRKRTAYPDYDIIVCDNSQSPNKRCCEPHKVNIIDGDDGNRLDYLREQKRLGNISLIENTNQGSRYGHGENIKKLLDGCHSDYALLFVSSAEIIDELWLNKLLGIIRGDTNALAVARIRPGGIHFDVSYIMTVVWPNMLLLDMNKYRDWGKDSDWDLDRISFSEWDKPELFKDLVLKNAPPDPTVFCDTGWKFYDRLLHDNPKGYTIEPMPSDIMYQSVNMIGGIDRNSHRPEIDYVQERFVDIRERLERLRG